MAVTRYRAVLEIAGDQSQRARMLRAACKKSLRRLKIRVIRLEPEAGK